MRAPFSSDKIDELSFRFREEQFLGFSWDAWDSHLLETLVDESKSKQVLQNECKLKKHQHENKNTKSDKGNNSHWSCFTFDICHLLPSWQTSVVDHAIDQRQMKQKGIVFLCRNVLFDNSSFRVRSFVFVATTIATMFLIAVSMSHPQRNVCDLVSCVPKNHFHNCDSLCEKKKRKEWNMSLSHIARIHVPQKHETTLTT